MGYHRPKILLPITVPTGGWDFNFQVSNAAYYNVNCTATIPAGTYFMAWDAQTDDFLWALADAMTDAITAAVGGARKAYATLSSDNKVVLHFRGAAFAGDPGRFVKLQWTTSDADLVKTLGFDESADDLLTTDDYPAATADYQHPYGWYADADGQLASLLVEDDIVVSTPQAVAYSGHSYAQQVGERYENELVLDWLPRDLTFSRGKSYLESPAQPYERNKGLECWWREARDGTRFRVYREGRNDASSPIDTFLNDLGSATQVRDSNKAWETDPAVHLSRVCHIVERYGSGTDSPAGRFLISAQTATTLTAPQAAPDTLNWEQVSGDVTCHVLDHRYQTYVVDLERMPEFMPDERLNVDYYAIRIPLLRYAS